MSIQLDITGVDQVMTRLGQLHGVALLRTPMQQSVQLVKADMQKYPAAPTGSKYRRTGTLGRRWATSVASASNGVTGTIGNNTTYAPYVQSHRLQARVHRGRWQTDALVMERRAHTIHGLFASAIRRALGG